jgi:hypothetical protein
MQLAYNRFKRMLSVMSSPVTFNICRRMFVNQSDGTDFHPISGRRRLAQQRGVMISFPVLWPHI